MDVWIIDAFSPQFMMPFGGSSMEQVFMAEYSAVFNALQHDSNAQRFVHYILAAW